MRTIDAGHRAFVVVCLFALLGQTLQGVVTAQSPVPAQENGSTVVRTASPVDETLPPAESIPSPRFLQTLPKAITRADGPVIKPQAPVIVSVIFDDKRIKSGQKLDAALSLTAITTTQNISVVLVLPTGLDYETTDR